ncbi:MULTISPECIES: hypothetical protein [Erwiniaceae]|uniref:hypothetical protein n=1 Tax=Erwiniaceae TaxID=1903409 RepID=UPI001EF00E36|nr:MULTISPECIES: hypothetical protein [Erwiniaceae]
MGIYTAFLDVAMAIGSPMLGWVGGDLGLGNIFLAGALTVLSTAIVAVLLIRRSALRKENAS